MNAVLNPIQWVIDKISSLFSWISKASSSVGNFLEKINPFSRSIDAEVNATVNQPQIDTYSMTRDVALSGSYYTPRTSLGSQVNQMASRVNSIANKETNIEFSYDGIEKILDNKLSQMVEAISKITINSPDVYLGTEKISEELDRIGGRNMKLYGRFRY